MLNRLDAGGIANAPSLTLAQFLRLADALDVDPCDLLSVEHPVRTDPEGQPDDPARLGAVLHDLNGAIPAVVVAEALGWTLPRLHAAADALTEQLSAAGMTVQRQSGRLALRACDDRHADVLKAVRQHPRASHSQRVVTPGRARLVYQAMQQPLSQHSLSDNDRREIAILMRAGILQLDNNRDVTLTDRVGESVNPR